MTHHWGYLGAMISAVLFGVSSTLNKIALENVNPLLIAALIYFIGGVLLFVVRLSPLNKRVLALLETPTETETKIVTRDYVTLAFVIVSGAVIAPVLLLYGLAATTAINTALLLNAESLLTVLIALSFLRERGAKKDYLGIILLLFGVVFLTTSGEFQKLTLTSAIMGNLLIVGACLFWSIDNNLSKFLSKKRDIILITGLKCFIGGSILLIVAFSLGIPFDVPLISVPYLLSVGAFSIAFSILFFLFALREIGSMRTGVVFSTSSLFGAVFAFIVLREAFTVLQFLAGLVMVLGVYVLYKK